VDGFHPVNMGKLLIGDEDGFIPCTPAGIQELLIRSKVPLSGKHVVIVGRSNIVGKPLASILVQKKEGANAVVTVCHTGVHDLTPFTRQAEVLIAAVGKPEIIRGDMLCTGCVVIDVGVNRIEDKSKKSGYRIVGDVHFESANKVAKMIAPVPGGVGPMTIAMLLRNTVIAAERTVIY
jgi:methylenetetrahydrofolate dehydrogenase (NADP+)/methenyltetrahydrofolate cyclohydrolase